ncbi:2,3-diaminopropionate biosynthesis protein SbnB [Streptomyces sp. MUM 178J]|uniref:2,3-diaminopropionate biosynthesis protein SbnB n=1 Tax=Streptomyces sp. MUM 178J TaxID=2791991 RepID=UPI001F037C92|nr:2,3-diaminopropionate biosynthesis protein SbnB [Streptomyces sp. MUM 178J]WRQ77939.1 2,3-diaminopropionate biosynthesis protein SbnB [Streptomyces sp. MUM 178J]
MEYPPKRPAVPTFSVISGAQVKRVLADREDVIVELISATYRLHHAGETVNPPSHFLRFPDRPDARIIALPAAVGGEAGADGIKWISSFPGNVQHGIPRASAVLVLNDPKTGYPYACLESSVISAVRTAASAALAADWLSRDRGRAKRVGFIGAGLIARYIHTYLAGTGWEFDSVGIHDVSAEHGAGFRDYLQGAGGAGEFVLHDSAESLIRSSDLLVFATVAGSPYIHPSEWFSHNPLVLNVSLRDLSPEIILGSANFLDDIEHCLKADTSPHLAEQQTGNREFVTGTLADVMHGAVRVPENRPVIFSPFGLGVLDIAVGKYVWDELHSSGELLVIDEFFAELRRYG